MLKSIINKDTVMKGLKVAGTIGGAIVIEGIKGVAWKGALTTFSTFKSGGIEGVKKLSVDDLVGRNKKRRKDVIDVEKIESKPEKTDVVIDAEVEVVEKRDLH